MTGRAAISPSSVLSPARAAAFSVLARVERGAFASDTLLAFSRNLESRDAGLASELVFGCLRFQAQLDFFIDSLARKTALDGEVRLALRMGVYQLRYLSRIPPHAAVGESVELVKCAKKRSAAGFVNAVLRRAAGVDPVWPDRATALSCPEWLLGSWEEQFGPEVAQGIASAALEPPETYVASTGRTQDIGSQSVVPLLHLSPGQDFLDLCAAPGNKTAQALESGVSAIACDLHESRLRALTDLPCRRVVLDATQSLPFAGRFDRVLADVPCSGTGTLRRNPEIKWRLRRQDITALQDRQTRILENALRALKPGGVLAYSTCSLQKAENEDVIARFPGPWTWHYRLPGVEPGDGFFAAVYRAA